MNRSFYNGVLGMKSYQFGIDVWGNNIANVNTAGYKENDVDFHSIFSQTIVTGNGTSPVENDVGLGGIETTTTQNFSQGSIQQTDNVFDLSINGNGFFSVLGSDGNKYYSRTGSFSRDNTGTLVSQTGEKLLGINPKTLSFDGKNWIYNSKIDTSNIFNNITALEPLIAPESIIFPAEATKEVSLKGNLNNSAMADDIKPANSNSDLGALYNTNGINMDIKNGQNLVFGFGNNINYDSGLITTDTCITDDEQDGKNVNIDFDVNDENIKLTLPDGSDKKTIIDAIAKALDDKNILYEKLDSGIRIKSENKLIIKNNDGDYFKNSAAEVLTYKDSNLGAQDFTTIGDFNKILQDLADKTYPNITNITIDKEGKINIFNNSDNVINATLLKANNSNDKFIENLGRLGNTINPNTASSSLKFNHSYEGFTGDIIDSAGNKNDLKFDFIKTHSKNNQTTWTLTISEISPEGVVLSTKTQDLIFDSDGGLLTPNKITIDNNGIQTEVKLGQNFSGITTFAKENTGYQYSQDGILEGYLDNYDINDEGLIVATFSNNRDGVIGAIPLFHFQNNQGLDNVGGNKYTPTSNSGSPITYKDINGNYLPGAIIKNYSLEMSNVKMQEAMTELLILQKAFGANAKSITTSDQMIQKAIDMKR